MPLDWILRTYLFAKKYKISLSSRGNWETNTTQLPDNKGIWYTDVSKKGELSGTGVYRQRGGQGISIPLGKYANIM